MNPFFSIIIPVYNGISNGLPQCLESIWRQPVETPLYEVVCIDDCSTDNTKEWLKKEMTVHPNLRLLENEHNMRQGGARNRGFRAANGKYIMLIDQDDYYHEGVFSEVYNHLAKSDLEILIVDCAYQSPGKVSNKLQHQFPHREVMTGDEIIEKNTIPYAPWKFIFLRSLVLENNLFFKENERIEDVDWVHLLVHHAQRVQYQPILFIHYNKSNISTTMTTYKSVETVYSTIRLGKRLDNMCNSTFAHSTEKVRKYINHLSQMFYHIGLRNYFFIYDSISNKSDIINQNISQTQHHQDLLIRIAQHHSSIFSFVSNCCVPFSRLAMLAYRKIKYS